MARGGKRPNSGRPKGSIASHTLEAQTLRERLIQRVIEEQEPLIEALLKQAKAGQMPALKEIFERVLGKVKEPIEIDDLRANDKLDQMQKDLYELLNPGKNSPIR